MSHSLPGADDITRVELPNGIVILSRPNYTSPSLVMRGYLNAGALFEPDEKLGLANFTAAALMRGVSRRSFQEIYELLESAGASLHFGGGIHTTSFGGQCLVEDTDMLLGLFRELICEPEFPKEQVLRLRSQMLAGLAIYAQDTTYQAQRAFDSIVYAQHPYSRPEEGLSETLQNLSSEDLAAFHRVNYGPRGMLISVVGGIDPQIVIEKISAALSGWRNPDQPDQPVLPAVSRLNAPIRHKIDLPGKSQADLVIGAAGPPRRSVDFTAANLGNNILGQFGMMGRLGEVVREREGLAYYVQSNLGGGFGQGPWDISAGVDPEALDRVIDLIQVEIRRFVNEPVSADELHDSQSSFIGSLPLTMESNHGVAASLVNLERYQLGLDYYRNYADMILSVSPEDILAAAQKYLNPESLAIGIAGP